MTKHHPTSRRVHRTHSDEDAFVAAALESSAWARTNQRWILIGTVVVVALFGGLLYYRNFQTSKVERATAELTNVRQTVLGGNRQLAQRDLQNFVTRYDGTAAADEARLMLAQIYLEDGKPADAIRAVEKMAARPGEAGGATAALLLGAAQEASKNPDAAEQTYLEIADEARFGFEKREALERAAAIRLAKGNPAGATELYQQAMDTYPEDAPERSVYQMRIAEVTATGARAGS
jgi:predicted negative regulator of RcsB-dependent stress response